MANQTLADKTATTTLSSGDLLYVLRDPAGTPVDRKITKANFEAAINAGTATALATGRTIAITGDLAYTSPSFDGSGNVTAAGTLATVNSNVGSFTNASVTVNAKGLVTAASSGTAPATASFTTIAVSGQSDVVADSASDTLTLAAGSNITITTNAGTDTITIAASGGGGTPTAITVANEASDTTCFPAFFTAATGDLGPKTNTTLTYNSAIGRLSEIATTTDTSSTTFQDLAKAGYYELNWDNTSNTATVAAALMGYTKHTSATSITGSGHTIGVLGFAEKNNASGTDNFVVGAEGRVGAKAGAITTAAALVGTFNTNTEDAGTITIAIGLYIPDQTDSGHISAPFAFYNAWAAAPIRTLGSVQTPTLTDETGANSKTVAQLVVKNATSVYTKQQNFGTATLTDGANISWNLDNAQTAKVTLGGNRTLSAPTNMVDGGTYILRVIQDGTGSRTLAYNAVFKWPGGTTPTLSTAAGAIDIITFTSDGTNMYGAIQKAFA